MGIRKTMQQCIDELRRSEHSAGMVANWLEPLKADLESVTAERDAMREVCEAMKVWKEEHWELWRPYPPEHPWQAYSTTEVTPKHKSDRGLVDALARLDATLDQLLAEETN